MGMLKDRSTLRAVVAELGSGANRPEQRRAHAEAESATLRMFLPLLPVAEKRVHAYYSGCLRRASLRCGGDSAARMVLDAVAEDMRLGGRSPDDIWDEIARGWTGRVPDHVLEEYREQFSQRVA